MAYATSVQIASEAKTGLADFTTSSTPTLAKVGEIIAEVEAKINAKVGRVYTAPVPASSQAELILRGISIALCTERVREIIEVHTGKKNEEQSPNGYTPKNAREDLEAIVEGTLPLPGATLLSADNGVKSYAVSNGLCPTFRKGVDQW